ncbi:hypothetical protein O181_123402 [Austropuccinia psidii MF-1]|uniref:Uncharacterized protein n=1 Tax=Austropuccinia psidii MF-1 TaxID=1389203 RepID=A0A9Q3Q5D5_9BASI|nr:hypothetical protein [Austropuccinia psidii MF-1]
MAANKDKPREKVEEVSNKRNSCQNCGYTDDYSKNFQKARKKIYFIEDVSGEGIQTKESDSESMGNAIGENSDDDQDPIEENLVE